jgi:tetratricopeptide (TPR) repeat protein
VCWSPDGTRLATASQDTTARVWDAAGGRELLTLKGHTGVVNSVSWSPDGKRLATGSFDGTAKVWEAAGGRVLFTLKGHTGEVGSVSWSWLDRWLWMSVAWSPDGQRLATGSWDGTAKVWDAAGGRELLKLKGHTDRLWSVAWSPDGTRLATGSSDGTAKVWEVAGGRELLTLQRHTGQVVRSVAWSPDGQRLATGSWDGTAKVWDAAGAAAVQQWARQDRAAQDHTELGQPEEAAAAFAKLVERTPESQAAVLMRLAEQCRKAGRLEQARQWWEQVLPTRSRAVAQRPDDRQAWRDLGTVRAELGQPEAAAAAFTRLVELIPESHRGVTLMGLAELDRKAGRRDRARQWWAQAVPLLTRAVAQRPDDRQAWKELGIVRAELGQPAEAATAFTKLMELTPDSRDENLWWSEDPAGIGAALAAHDEIFGRVVRARPRDRTLLIARFHYFGRRRRWREAAAMAARIIEVGPEDRQARQYRRALLFFTGDVEGYRGATREDLAALKERNPNGFGWLQLLGQFQFPRADETGPPPKDEWESLSRGILAYREGQYFGAIRHLTEATTSQNPEALTLAHLFLAMAHQRLGQGAEARRELEASRRWFDGLGGATGDGSYSISENVMNYGWTAWVSATIVRHEAEALIVYAPIFPADPFAR